MKQFVHLALAASLITPSLVSAAVTEDDIQELRDQLAAMSARLEDLAAENAELKAAQRQSETKIEAVETTVAEAPAFTAPAESWTDRVALNGDFRYRYEWIDVEGSSTRNRNRIRARTNLKADVTDNIEVGFGLATGGDDPVSTNQTLGAGGSSKDVVLNLAYADWAVTDGLNLIAGKFKNPLTRVGGQPLTWDGDWTPEGLALKYKRGWFFANAFGSFLESDTRKTNDMFAFGGQFGAAASLGDVKLTGGIGYYAIPSAGNETPFGDPADPGDFYGNTAVEQSGLPCGTTGADCVYLYDYNLTQVFAEASFNIGDWPMLVFADVVTNSDADDDDLGWTIGAKLGQAKDRGQMQFAYYYAEKEADSMLGLLTDSDFGGGGTDSSGHWLQFNVGVNKSWTVGAQYFINEIDVASGSKRDFDRLMIDMQWKWK
jgi:hypothetical protein